MLGSFFEIIYISLIEFTAQETTMDERPTAEIIAFPARPADPAQETPASSETLAETLAEDPQERLRRALTALNAALATQRAAVKSWRDSLSDLKGTMQGLGTSLSGYRDALGTLGTRVTTLNTEARRLEAWADDKLGQHGSPTA
jgi:chromosome segregation ATPase